MIEKNIINMKRTIRLTESDLKRVIKESVKKILKENFYDKGYNEHGDPVDDKAYIDSDFMKKVHETDGKRFTDEEIKTLYALKSKLGY